MGQPGTLFEYYSFNPSGGQLPSVMASLPMTQQLDIFDSTSCHFSNTDSVYVHNFEQKRIQRFKFTYGTPSSLIHNPVFDISYAAPLVPTQIVSPQRSSYIVILCRLQNKILIVKHDNVTDRETLDFSSGPNYPKQIAWMDFSSFVNVLFFNNTTTLFTMKRLQLRDSPTPTGFSSFLAENIL